MSYTERMSRPPHNWTLESIKSSIERYVSENNRLPTARDFDTSTYLPNARLIQRDFGGLPKIRRDLGIKGPEDYTKGSVRSVIAAERFADSRAHEEEFYTFLINHIPEMAVHEQKRLRPGNISSDFFIYTDLSAKNKGFAIDIFYAGELFNLKQIINIKLKRYITSNIETFLVAKINNCEQYFIDRMMANKTNPWPPHIHVMNETHFKSLLKLIYKDRGGTDYQD